MRRSIRLLVRERAEHRCEYCHMPQACDYITFQIDHIRARKHRGTGDSTNLAYSCFPCNVHKSSNVAGFDPLTDKLVSLYHPRQDTWDQHFRWYGAKLIGKTARGRTTIAVLQMNAPDRVEHRRLLILTGDFIRP